MATGKAPENSLKLEIRYDRHGLVPAIAQDADNGQVLMVAWMNQEALNHTLQTGKATFWSRSRGKLWCKGEQSGHTLNVKQLLLDCDQDVILLQCRLSAGAGACHVGYRSCFYRAIADEEHLRFVAQPVFDPEQVYKK